MLVLGCLLHSVYMRVASVCSVVNDRSSTASVGAPANCAGARVGALFLLISRLIRCSGLMGRADAVVAALRECFRTSMLSPLFPRSIKVYSPVGEDFVCPACLQ